MIALRTARGTRLTARLDDGNVVVLYRGRPIASLTREAILRELEGGLHLTQDADPRFYLDREALDFITGILLPPS